MGWDVNVHLHLLHEVDSTWGMGWGLLNLVHDLLSKAGVTLRDPDSSNESTVAERQLCTQMVPVLGQQLPLGVPCFQVSHQMRQYCKDIWDPNLGNLSRKAGTQCLDADWRSLKTFLPKQTKRKQRQQGQSSMNPRLTTRCYQWVWRRSLHNAKPDDLLKAFSKHIKKSK